MNTTLHRNLTVIRQRYLDNPGNTAFAAERIVVDDTFMDANDIEKRQMDFWYYENCAFSILEKQRTIGQDENNDIPVDGTPSIYDSG
jgi:hypothetical protein